MKLFMIVLSALTLPISLLILIGRIRNKPFKSCGAACECIDGNSLELGL